MASRTGKRLQGMMSPLLKQISQSGALRASTWERVRLGSRQYTATETDPLVTIITVHRDTAFSCSLPHGLRAALSLNCRVPLLAPLGLGGARGRNGRRARRPYRGGLKSLGSTAAATVAHAPRV